MAEEVQIQGSQETGKVRNPLGVIGLMLVTLGIYGIVWYYKINKEMAATGQARGTDECGTNPVTSVIAVTLGIFILVPPFVSTYNTWKRLQACERLTGAPAGMEPGLGFLLSILLSPVGTYILQSNLNKVLQAQAGAAPVATPAPAPAQA
jgi:hypothetical protein